MSRRSLLLVALIVVSLVTAGVIAAIKFSSAGSDLVKIELRGKPAASITMNGKSVGKTPLTLNMKPAKEPVDFEATFEIHLINPATRDKKTVIKKLTKSVVPDAPQSVDFDIKDAKEVETK